ncbi:MAG TPA: adenylyltransferase/cytidyltransferase family protein [Patescibacteria group bacterium]
MTISFDKLSEIRKKHSHERIVLGSGVFDLLHWGHIPYLKALKKYGDIVVVGVMDDAGVRHKKGLQRPVLAQDHRVLLVDSIKGVDYTFVAPFDPTDLAYTKIFRHLKPDVFYTTNPRWETFKELEDINIIIGDRYVPGYPASTTDIISEIIKKSSAEF